MLQQKLPKCDFRWVENLTGILERVKKLHSEDDYGYILEVDLELSIFHY